MGSLLRFAAKDAIRIGASRHWCKQVNGRGLCLVFLFPSVIFVYYKNVIQDLDWGAFGWIKPYFGRIYHACIALKVFGYEGGDELSEKTLQRKRLILIQAIGLQWKGSVRRTSITRSRFSEKAPAAKIWWLKSTLIALLQQPSNIMVGSGKISFILRPVFQKKHTKADGETVTEVQDKAKIRRDRSWHPMG